MTLKKAKQLLPNTNKSDEEIKAMIGLADSLSDVVIGLAKDLYMKAERQNRKGGRNAVANWPKK